MNACIKAFIFSAFRWKLHKAYHICMVCGKIKSKGTSWSLLKSSYDLNVHQKTKVLCQQGLFYGQATYLSLYMLMWKILFHHHRLPVVVFHHESGWLRTDGIIVSATEPVERKEVIRRLWMSVDSLKGFSYENHRNWHRSF